MHDRVIQHTFIEHKEEKKSFIETVHGSNSWDW